MQVARAGCAVLVAAWTLAAGACDTGARGVEDCRLIEDQRCQAAVHCEVGLSSDNVDVCTHFSYDNCLHGMNVENPGKNAVDLCVEAIQTAAACAEDEPDQPANDCEAGLAPLAKTTVCQIINQPEEATECAFLVPDRDDEDKKPEPPDEPDAGEEGDGG